MSHPIFSHEAFHGPQTEHPTKLDEPIDLIDRSILTLQLAGSSHLEIALQLTLPRDEVVTRVGRPAYQALKKRIEGLVVDRVAEIRSTEPISRARAAAPDAMGTMIRLSKNATDTRVRLKAAEGVLRYAGVEPPRKVELTAPDRLLDLMTAAELTALADRKIWPSRFRDQLRHLLPAPAETVIEAEVVKGSDDPPIDSKVDTTDWDEPPPPGDGGISEDRLKATFGDKK